ncbi:MAG: hypothetical protein ACPGWM_11640, partial [Flavobacteriales bacterium]
FMFPEHISLFETDPEIWRNKRELVYKTVFINQQRNLFIGIALAVVSLAWAKGPKFLRILFGVIGLTFLTMNGTGSWLPNWFYFWFFPVILVVATIWVSSFFTRENSKNELFLPIAGLLTTALIFFTSAHFVIGRYMLFVIPLVVVSCVVLIQLALKRSAWLFNVLMICLGLISYHHMNKADLRMSSVDNMNYVNRIHVLAESISYLEQNVDLNKCISGTFVLQQALENPVQGYRNTKELPSCISNKILPNTNYVVSLSFIGEFKTTEGNSEFEKIWETKNGKETGIIYRRK